MADAKITALTAATTPADADLIPLVQDVATTPVTKKVTWTVLKAFLKTYFDSLYSTAPVFSNGFTTKEISDANGATTVFAHGLGKSPTRITLETVYVRSANPQMASSGVWDSSGQHCLAFWKEASSSGVVYNLTSSAIRICGQSDRDSYQLGVVTVDATNITITWAKTGSPTAENVFQILWKAQA